MGAKFSSGGGATVFYDKTDTPGEIVTELVNASDGAGLHLEAGGTITLANSAAEAFGTSDFSLEFVLNRTANNTNNNVIYESHSSGNNRITLKALTGGDLVATFTNSSGVNADYNTGYDIDVDLNTVTHYALTFDRSGDLTVYKNGNSVATISIAASSAVDIGASNTNTGRIGYVTTYGIIGTFYRFRTWNKLLSSAEVQTAFERADVPFAEQHGSASNEITNGNFETNTSGWTSENTSVFQRNTTSPISGTGDLKWTGDGSGYPGAISNSFSLTAGKKYRIKFTYRVTSGTVYLKFGKTAGAASAAVAGISEVALTAASNTEYEATVTPTETTTAYIVFRGNNNTTPTMFVDLVDFVQIGCVSDYDLAYANPTQSRMVQDRSGAADGTASTSGVTQVQPVVQLNSTSARIGTSAATPADGDLQVSGNIGVNVAPDGSDWNANSKIVHAYQNDSHGAMFKAESNSTSVVVSAASKGYIATLEAKDLAFWTNGSERLTIDASGNILAGAAALDANVGAKKMQLEGSASTDVGPEMLLHNPGQGGGAASMLTFGGKASGTEGYTAAIKATNTGTLTIGTAHASGGFSEPSADLTINSAGTVSVTNATSTDIGTLSNETQLYLENSTANKPVGITFGASNASGGPSGTGTSSARVSALASGGAGVFDADLVFETRSGSTIAERMRIASDGNIEQHTDSNGIVKFVVKNESTGTSARAMVNVISDHGNLDLSMNGTNYTGVAGWADSGVVSTGSVVGGGLKLNAVAGGLALQTNQTTRLSIANSTGEATFSGDTKLGNGLVSNYVTHVSGLDDTVAISFTFPSQASRYIHQMLELRVAMGDDGANTATPTFLRYAFTTLTTASGITQMDASLGTGITASTGASGTTLTITLTEGSGIAMDSVTVFATVTSGHGDAKCTGMTVA